MTTNGILLHVYHLEANGWEGLVWGYPGTDKFGTAAQFIYTLLSIPATEEIKSIIYSGPSTKDGLTEGAYTKQFLLDRVDKLRNFPTLKGILSELSPDEYDIFLQRVHGLVVGPVIKNTVDEIAHAAKFFNGDHQVDRVFQIAAASHAPRCLQSQLVARQNGMIPPRQPWHVTASDVGFSGTGVEDVIVLEPPHRGDDPMVGFTPTLAAAIKPFFTSSAEEKKQLIKVIQDTVSSQGDAGKP